MKWLLVASLCIASAFAQDWSGWRDEVRRAQGEARRARIEAMREARTARLEAARWAREVRVQMERDARRMREELRREASELRARGRTWRL